MAQVSFRERYEALYQLVICRGGTEFPSDSNH